MGRGRLQTRPYGERAAVVRSPGELACRPCIFTPLQRNCPYDRRCMTGIPAAAVAMRDWGLAEETTKPG